jgi:hypothetical protein
MKAKFNQIWLVLVLLFLLFHGCVLKAQRTMQGRECYKGSRDKAFEECAAHITYFSVLFNLKEILHAWD